MTKKLLFATLLSGMIGAETSVFAQSNSSPVLPCGTDMMMEQEMQRNPEYAKMIKHFDSEIRNMNTSTTMQKVSASQYTIPVVVHIMHTYGADNISDAQVLDALRILNEDFNKLNADTVDVLPTFQGRYANVGIEFKLAKLDPSGNPTNGINRVYTPQTNSAGDDIKTIPAANWDRSKYLNIWVVNSIASGAGGYSFRPCLSPSGTNYREGVVVRNAQFGSIGRSSGNFSARTLTHEVGHYLGLPHTWGGSNTPGTNGSGGTTDNCTIDDGVQDTPNTLGVANMSCNLNSNSCGAGTPGDEVDNVQNFMDYSNCAKMFTEGQKAVMLLNTGLASHCRNNLWQQANLSSTGTAAGYVAAPGVPKADFNVNASNICEGTVVNFTNFTYNTDLSGVTYQWSFPGGTPSTSTAENPTVTYPTSGTYNVTLTSTNSAGTSTQIVRNDAIIVKSSTQGEVAPMQYGMENASFPANGTDPNKDWTIVSDNTTSNSTTWERTGAASIEGAYSIRIRNQHTTNGAVNAFISPTILTNNVTNATLKFKYAYAQKSATQNDALKIYVSTNCGATWILRRTIAGSSLATNGGQLVSSTFVPNNTQWVEGVLPLTPFSNTGKILIKFESVSENGNTLYLDDVRIGGTLVGLDDDIKLASELNVFPNPSDGTAIVAYELHRNASVNLEVYNIAGQKVGGIANITAAAGKHEVNLNEVASDLNAGVYFVKLFVDGQVFVKKALIF